MGLKTADVRILRNDPALILANDPKMRYYPQALRRILPSLYETFKSLLKSEGTFTYWQFKRTFVDKSLWPMIESRSFADFDLHGIRHYYSVSKITGL